MPFRPFQPGLMFTDEERSLPQSGVPERCSNEKDSDLACKHLNRLEKLTMDKHSSDEYRLPMK